MLFSRNKAITSEEYSKVQELIAELTRKIADLNHRFELIETSMRSLRGLINRKIHPDEENATTKQGKDLNSTVLLPDNGAII